jgi:hypothetical protein
MNPIIRNILAVVAGVLIGGLVNMGIIIVGSMIISVPEGVDVTTTESIRASMHLFRPIHFVTPFLAHAGGTFVGALIAVIIAASRRFEIALGIGAFFLLGGIFAAYQIAAPTWFTVIDLVFAYLPVAWLGWKTAAPSSD